MDSNPISQPATATPMPEQPVEQPPTNNKMLWLIGGVVVLILVMGGIYWYSSSQQKVTKTVQPTPTPQTVETLETDLNSLSLDDLEGEFSSVDSDLQGL